MATVYTRAAKGSALTWTEGDANITNLNAAKIENVVEDTTPQLGGNLDLQANKINTSTTNGSIELEPNGTGNVYVNGRLRVGSGTISSTYTGSTPTGGHLTLDGSAVSLLHPSNSGGIQVSSTGSTVAGPTASLGATAGNASLTSTATTTITGVTTSISSSSGNLSLTAGTGRVVIELLTYPNTDGTNGQVLTTDGNGTLSWSSASGGLSDVVNDTTPQLGGDLDVNGKKIVSASNGNIAIEPNGTGKVTANKNIETTADVKAKELWSTNSTGDEGGQINLATAATNTSLSGGNVVIDINQNQFRIFEMGGSNRGVYIDLGTAATSVGTNLLSAGGLTDIVNDTSPQLGGSLDVNGQKIVSVSNGNIEIEPNGTGDVYLTADLVRVGDSNAAATITTNGTGNLVLNTNSGTNSGSITVTQGANANITITPNGTGQTLIKNIEYNENIFALGTTSGTITPDVANGNVQTITLNGNLTFSAFSSPVAGQSLTLIVNTGGTSRTLTSTMKFAGGEKTLSTTNTTDIITVFYDGTNYWASLGKDFK